MALGGKGVISVFSNPFPIQMCEITNAMLDNNIELARKQHNKYLKLMNSLFIETSPMPVKFACSYLGFCKNTLRLPLIRISENSENIIKKEIGKIK
jgi:4-hydroxy-tetrahydrodipicolinate synthase